MRVVFMGTPDFAVPTLDGLVEAGHDVVLVVAQPDRPAGRGQQLRQPPVARRALELGLPLAQPRAIKSGRFPMRYAELAPDVSIVIAYGRILTAFLLDQPRFGCVNVHASLLPRWRGAAPIQAALLAGDDVTGVCTQRMEEGLDTGPIYKSLTTQIESNETAGTLHDRLAILGARVAVDTLAHLEHLMPVAQDPDTVTWAPKLGRDDGNISWDEDAVVLERRVRAMTPWPGGRTRWKNAWLKLLRVRTGDGIGVPGTIMSTSPLTVACRRGVLELVTVQAPGRRPVTGAEFANGNRLRVGGEPWPS